MMRSPRADDIEPSVKRACRSGRTDDVAAVTAAPPVWTTRNLRALVLVVMCGFGIASCSQTVGGQDDPVSEVSVEQAEDPGVGTGPATVIEQPSAQPGGPTTTVVVSAPSIAVAPTVTEETVPGGSGPTETAPPQGEIDFGD